MALIKHEIIFFRMVVEWPQFADCAKAIYKLRILNFSSFFRQTYKYCYGLYEDELYKNSYFSPLLCIFSDLAKQTSEHDMVMGKLICHS